MMKRKRSDLKLIPFLCLVVLQAEAFAQDRITGKPFATRSEVIAHNGMAATSQPLATQIAIDILKQGGTAIDAAIAANAMLGLAEPMMDGVGGDLFALIWDAKTQKLYGLNASGRSPYTLTLDYFKAKGLKTVPANGPLSISVPGCVDGWFEMHKKFGKLPMATVLKPTIEYARDDFPVSEQVAFDWELFSRTFREQHANFREVYTVNGKTPVKGEIFRNPYLANTLEKIAKGVVERFEVALQIIEPSDLSRSHQWLRGTVHGQVQAVPVVSHRCRDSFPQPLYRDLPNLRIVVGIQGRSQLEVLTVRP
jgi:gamma-glutamyltranspeptidase/glutathione hydrolase